MNGPPGKGMARLSRRKACNSFLLPTSDYTEGGNHIAIGQLSQYKASIVLISLSQTSNRSMLKINIQNLDVGLNLKLAGRGLRNGNMLLPPTPPHFNCGVNILSRKG